MTEPETAIPIANGLGMRRWIIPAVLLVSVVIAYYDRMNLSFAISAIGEDMGWDANETASHAGQLFSIFFIGYGIANVFLTPVAERFGPRRSLLLIVVLFSLFTMAGAPLSFSFLALALTRFCLGLGEGVHFPMMSALTKSWFPVHERSRANGIWVSGILIATVSAPWVIVPIVEHLGWRGMFLVLGACGMLITLPVLVLFTRDSPAKTKWMSAGEIAYIAAGQEDESQVDGGYAFLKSPTFWNVQAVGILNNFAAFGILMWLPSYFEIERGLALDEIKIAASLPYVAGIAGIVIFSWLGDRYSIRALLCSGGFFLASICVLGAAFAPTVPITIAMFSLAVLFQSSYTTHEWALLQHILPGSSIGKGAGFYNGVGLIVGGGLGQVVIGQAIALTGSFKSGIFVITIAAGLAALVMNLIHRKLYY